MTSGREQLREHRGAELVDFEGCSRRAAKFTAYQGSRQPIDGELKGKKHVNSIGPESPQHRGHRAVLANKQPVAAKQRVAAKKQRGKNCRMEE